MPKSITYYLWSFVERFGASLVSFGGNLVLAYLLEPSDFGMVAMLGIFTSLIFTLVDCGLSDGLLRESKPTDRDFNTLFFFNLASGTALCLLFAALSPIVAWYMDQPALQPVMAALGVGAVFSGLTIAQFTRLRSRLQFRLVAIINLGSIVLALACAIAAALAGWGYWSLVVLQAGFPAMSWLLLALFSRWNLRWEFDVMRFRQLWRFGANLLLSYTFVQIANNVFAFVLGKFYNPLQAGYMGQAQKLQQTPTNSIEGAITSTSFVLIAKETQPDKRRAAILRMLGITTLVIALLCGTLIGLGRPIIDILLPDKWLPAVPFVQLMAVWGLVYPLCNFMQLIFKIYDRTAVIRNIIFIEKACIVVSAFVLYHYGVATIILAATAISATALIAYMVAASRVTSIPFSSLLGNYLRSLLAAIPLAALSLLFH